MPHKYPWKWNLTDLPTPTRGKVFSCFAGGGGSSLGYKLAGFDVIGALEIDPRQAEMYRVNLKPKHLFTQDIRAFRLRDDLPPELFALDILDGSPPCSTFSMSGQREAAWGVEKKFREGQQAQTLDDLFFEFTALAGRLQPKMVVAENVKGLLMGKAKAYVSRIYEELRAAGYVVGHWLLDASKMGVPQRRESVFFVGVRNDIADALGLRGGLFGDVLGLRMDFSEPGIPFGEVRTERGAEWAKPGTGYAAVIQHWQPGDRDFADILARGEGRLSGFNNPIISDHEIAPTITSSFCARSHDLLRLSIGDLLAVGTWPEDYDFIRPRTISAVQYVIGMSVPPVMAAQVADTLFTQVFQPLNTPKNTPKCA